MAADLIPSPAPSLVPVALYAPTPRAAQRVLKFFKYNTPRGSADGLDVELGGECFGYRDGDDLFAYHGQQVGRFHGDEVHGSDGRYLGEVKNQNRLISHRSKQGWRKSGFSPVRRGGYARYAGYAGYAMYAGYEDFPSPDRFR